MAKELNPELFGERRNAHSGATEPTPEYTRNVGDTPGFLDVDRQLLEIRQQAAAFQDEQRKLGAQMQEFMKTSHLKLERLQQQMARLEHNHNGLAQETGHKLTQMNQKFIERKTLDQKIQDMVDRYTNVIKSFEVRMHHLQKLLADRETQMMAAQAALNEAKMEIARLKRL